MSTGLKRTQSFPMTNDRSARARTAPRLTAAALAASAEPPPTGHASPQVNFDPLATGDCGGGAAGTDVDNASTVLSSNYSPTDYSEDDDASPRNEDHANEDFSEADDAGAVDVPILKVCGKAEHPTLGIVTILQIGSLGAKIEYWSVRDATLKERQVLLSDLVPLPDEYDLGAENYGTPDQVADDPLQARRLPLNQ